MQTAPAKKRGKAKTREGVVVSDKMEKTVVVAVTRQVRHAAVGKYVRRTKKYFAHDPRKECRPGDFVRISETRPLSRLKSWKISGIIRRAE